MSDTVKLALSRLSSSTAPTGLVTGTVGPYQVTLSADGTDPVVTGIAADTAIKAGRFDLTLVDTQTLAGAANIAPVAGDDTSTITIGEQTTIYPLVNDTDADGNPLTIFDVSSVSGGGSFFYTDTSITVTADGAAAVGTDIVFDYSISDGQGGSDTARVTLTVQDVPDRAPAIINFGSIAGPEYLTINGDDFTTQTFNIIDQTGSDTTLDVTVTGGDMNSVGRAVGVPGFNGTLYCDDVTTGNLFINSGNTATIAISGMTPGEVRTLGFVASRDTADARRSRITDGTTTVEIQANANPVEAIKTGDFTVDANGQIVLTLSIVSGSFGYISGISLVLKESERVLEAPEAFTAAMWSTEPAPSPSGDKSYANVTALPSDNGTTATAMQYSADGGSTWTTFPGGVGTGKYLMQTPMEQTTDCMLRLVNPNGSGPDGDQKSVTPVHDANAPDPAQVHSNAVYIYPFMTTAGNVQRFEAGRPLSAARTAFTVERLTLDGADISGDVTLGGGNGFRCGSKGILDGVVVYNGIRYGVSGEALEYHKLLTSAQSQWGSEANGQGFIARIPLYTDTFPNLAAQTGITPTSLEDLKSQMIAFASSNPGGTLYVNDCNFPDENLSYGGTDFAGINVIAKNLGGVVIGDVTGGVTNLTITGWSYKRHNGDGAGGGYTVDYCQGARHTFNSGTAGNVKPGEVSLRRSRIIAVDTGNGPVKLGSKFKHNERLRCEQCIFYAIDGPGIGDFMQMDEPNGLIFRYMVMGEVLSPPSGAHADFLQTQAGDIKYGCIEFNWLVNSQRNDNSQAPDVEFENINFGLGLSDTANVSNVSMCYNVLLMRSAASGGAGAFIQKGRHGNIIGFNTANKSVYYGGLADDNTGLLINNIKGSGNIEASKGDSVNEIIMSNSTERTAIYPQIEKDTTAIMIDVGNFGQIADGYEERGAGLFIQDVIAASAGQPTRDQWRGQVAIEDPWA